MKTIKIKRNLENYIIRDIPKSILTLDSNGKTIIDINNPKYLYGKIPNYKVDKECNYILTSDGQKIKNTIDINVFLTQKNDLMGIYTNHSFTPKTEQLTQIPINFNSFQYGRLPGSPLSFYIKSVDEVTGNSDDSNLKQVFSYRKDVDGNDIYVENLNVSKDPKNTFDGVIDDSPEKTIYKLGASISNIENTGVEFTTYKDIFIKSTDEYGKPYNYLKTDFKLKNGGLNINNVSLNALIKKEEYLGIVFKPEIDSSVFINRGVDSIFERHMILSEIKTTNDIDNNRGGYIRR